MKVSTLTRSFKNEHTNTYLSKDFMLCKIRCINLSLVTLLYQIPVYSVHLANKAILILNKEKREND